MENLLDNASNQISKLRTKNWIEINDESRGGYTTGSDIKFKTAMINLVYVIIPMYLYL